MNQFYIELINVGVFNWKKTQLETQTCMQMIDFIGNLIEFIGIENSPISS